MSHDNPLMVAHRNRRHRRGLRRPGRQSAEASQPLLIEVSAGGKPALGLATQSKDVIALIAAEKQPSSVEYFVAAQAEIQWRSC